MTEDGVNIGHTGSISTHIMPVDGVSDWKESLVQIVHTSGKAHPPLFMARPCVSYILFMLELLQPRQPRECVISEVIHTLCSIQFLTKVCALYRASRLYFTTDCVTFMSACLSLTPSRHMPGLARCCFLKAPAPLFQVLSHDIARANSFSTIHHSKWASRIFHQSCCAASSKKSYPTA